MKRQKSVLNRVIVLDDNPDLKILIPRCLQAATGWGIRPVAGLLHPRDFLNGVYIEPSFSAVCVLMDVKCKKFEA